MALREIGEELGLGDRWPCDIHTQEHLPQDVFLPNEPIFHDSAEPPAKRLERSERLRSVLSVARGCVAAIRAASPLSRWCLPAFRRRAQREHSRPQLGQWSRGTQRPGTLRRGSSRPSVGMRSSSRENFFLQTNPSFTAVQCPQYVLRSVLSVTWGRPPLARLPSQG